MDTCKNCNEPVTGKFCSNCGNPADLKRINGRYIFHEIAHFFYAEKGWLYTVKRMLVAPGDSVRQYLTEDRSRYIKPITFAIVTSLIYTIICHFFQIDTDTFNTQLSGEAYQEMLPTQTLLTNWVIDNNGYATMIIGLLMAFWIKLFFRKSAYNLFEFFVLLCYLSGITTLISSVLFIIQGLTNLSLISTTVLIVAAYYTWGIAQFFDKRKVGNYIKGLLSHFLGSLTCGILITFIAIFVDIIIKN